MENDLYSNLSPEEFKLKAQEELSNKVVGIWSSAKMKEIESDPLKFYNESDDKNTQA